MPASLSHRKRMLAHLEQQDEAASRLLLQPVPVASVESVMSRSNGASLFTGYPRLQSVEVLAAEARPLPQPVELTAQQQLALFMLIKSELCRELVETLRKSTVMAGAAEFAHLVALGWAERKPGSRYHDITPIGRFQGDRLAKKAAFDLDVHLFITSGARFQTSVRCSCGWTYYHNRNEGHERRAFARRASEHLADVGKRRAAIVAGSSNENVDQQQEGRADG
jgi:hypothetical protein